MRNLRILRAYFALIAAPAAIILLFLLLPFPVLSLFFKISSLPLIGSDVWILSVVSFLAWMFLVFARFLPLTGGEKIFNCNSITGGAAIRRFIWDVVGHNVPMPRVIDFGGTHQIDADIGKGISAAYCVNLSASAKPDFKTLSEYRQQLPPADVILASGVVEYFEHSGLLHLLNEIRASLVSGGVLVIGESYYGRYAYLAIALRNLLSAFTRILFGEKIRHWLSSELEERLRMAGFCDITIVVDPYIRANSASYIMFARNP